MSNFKITQKPVGKKKGIFGLYGKWIFSIRGITIATLNRDNPYSFQWDCVGLREVFKTDFIISDNCNRDSIDIDLWSSRKLPQPRTKEMVVLLLNMALEKKENNHRVY